MKKIIFSLIAVLIIILPCCKSLNHTQKGTGIGAAAGAGAGALLTHGSAWGILIGAAVGGSAGYLIGNKMDKQAKEIKQAVPDAQVERVGEGINLTFNSGLLFTINSSALSDSAKLNLDNLAQVLVKYPDENILTEGHTDDTGPDNFNMELSKKRAYAVANYLQMKGIDSSHFIVKWYGETQPKYPNTSEENRIKNRRVELAIYANDAMKKQAADSTANKN
jgi:outer membrane protein OmpA-like peptidoglycan-associated protein